MLVRVLVLLLTAVAVTAAPTTHELDPAQLDPRYPDMAQWAEAGLQAGALETGPRRFASLKPGDDLAAAVREPNRTLRLAAGTYPITATLRLADGVVLTGAGAGQTRLVVKLRAAVPAGPNAIGFMPWTAGVLFDSVHGAGIENLTVTMDNSLPPPPDPRDGARGYVNDPADATDLHVVLVRFVRAENCWVGDCKLLNSGTHPLTVQGSRHVTVSYTDIDGAYNKASDSGSVTVTGSEYCLFEGLNITDINHFVLHQGSGDFPCRFNVLVNSRLNVDVRFRDADSGHNLIQGCVISVPAWHPYPPISQGRAEDRERPPGKGNLIYLCTITRNFSVTGQGFSIADNPNKVYRVQDHFTLSTTTEEAGPAPQATTLWPVH